MAVSLETFIRQLEECAVVSEDVLSQFIPPQATPQSAEELAKALIRNKKLTKFQAEEISKGRGRNLTLGNYVLLDKLGQGGMGMVLKAEHKRMKRIVALKVMSPVAVKTPDALKRFHREVEAAAKLQHPNIVTAHDADEVNGTHFLVMEYVEGSDLSAHVKRNGPLTVTRAVTCVTQAARGLQFAHDQGVVHRDIKPANLLVDAKGTVKILDMGLARVEGAATGEGELTTTGAVMGTVDYMAPEQALSTKSADARSDIYSLGISLWYLLTARCAYDGDTLMAKLLAHRDSPIPSLTEARPEVPASLDAVFQKMVAKKPDERYQSMSQVLAALERLDLKSGAANRTSGEQGQFLQGSSSSAAEATRLVDGVQLTATAAQVSVTRDLQPTMTAADPEEATKLLSPTLTRLRKAKSKKTAWNQNHWMIGGVVGTVALLAAGFLVLTKGTPEKNVSSVPAGTDRKPESVAAPSKKDLLKAIQLEQDAIEGVWRRDANELISPVQPFAQIGIGSKLPDDYRLILEVTRQSGTGAFVIGLPVGQSRCVASIDVQPTTHQARLEQMSAAPLGNSRVTATTNGLTKESRAIIECEVHPTSVHVSLNSEPIMHFSGDVSGVTTPGYWQTAKAEAFLGACLSRFRIHRIELDEVKPETPRPAQKTAVPQ